MWSHPEEVKGNDAWREHRGGFGSKQDGELQVLGGIVVLDVVGGRVQVRRVKGLVVVRTGGQTRSDCHSAAMEAEAGWPRYGAETIGCDGGVRVKEESGRRSKAAGRTRGGDREGSAALGQRACMDDF